MREKIYNFLGDFVVKHSGKIIVVSTILVLIGIALSSGLSMKNQFSDMMPKGIPQVEEFTKIADNYPSTATIMIGIEDTTKNRDNLKSIANIVADSLKTILEITPLKNQKLTIWQKIAIANKKFPVEGVKYDTINLVKRIDYKNDTKFISQHGFMLQKSKDLKNMIDMFSSVQLNELLVNINNNLEKEYVDDDENIATLDGENQAVQSIDGLYNFVNTLTKYSSGKIDSSKVVEAVNELLSGNGYFISPDNSMVLLMVQPAVSTDQWDDILLLGVKIKEKLKVLQQKYPQYKITASGTSIIGTEEMEATKKDFGLSSIIALLLILLLLISSFGSWKYPFYAVIVLLVSIIITTAIIALKLRYLDMMSASFGLILIGLGIDFGIHVISGYRDAINYGKSPNEAIKDMYKKVASGVVTGGLTTAIVFFSLLLTRFKAISNMGFSIGVGIVSALVFMLILLPAMIVWDNKGYSVFANFLRKIKLGFIVNIHNTVSMTIFSIFKKKFFQKLAYYMNFHFLGDIAKVIIKPWVSVLIIIGFTILAILSYNGAKSMGFEYNMLELEPKGMPSVLAQQKIIDRYGMSSDYILFTSKSVKEERELVAKAKKLGERSGLFAGVDGISEFIKPDSVQQQNIPLIKDFKKKITKINEVNSVDKEGIKTQLQRLHDNFVEMGELSITSKGENNKIIKKCDEIVGKKDADSKILAIAKEIDKIDTNKLKEFQTIVANQLKNRLQQMCDTSKITLADLPNSIKERYIASKDSMFLVTILPNDNVWNEKYLRKIMQISEEVSPKATGTPMVNLLFIDLIKDKGKLAIIVGAIAIVLFLLLDFLSIKYTVMAIVPLFVGTLLMVGLMYVFGYKFNYANFMALPLIIGIGIDDGVHILHRYRLEGKFSIPTVIYHTGRAILLTSLTTGIGFGSMAFASHRGIASMGAVLTFGVMSCFVASAILLPAIINLYERVFKKSKI